MVPLFGYYFQGGYHPVGGSGKLADVLAAAVRERGGRAAAQLPGCKDPVENGRAAGLVLADGRRLSARAVVANADLKRTFLELIEPAELPDEFRARIAAASRRRRHSRSISGSTSCPTSGPGECQRRSEVGHYRDVAVDPSAAPSGHSTLTLIRLLRQDEARSGSRAAGPDWKEWHNRRTTVSARISLATMIAAAEQFIPGLSSHIVYRDEASPVTFARYDWSSAGSIYGVRKPCPAESAKPNCGPRPRREAPPTGRASRPPSSPVPSRRTRWCPDCSRRPPSKRTPPKKQRREAATRSGRIMSRRDDLERLRRR